MAISSETSLPAPQIDFDLPEDKSLAQNLTDCLNFSPAFNAVGFETLSDSVLREMNERARLQLTKQQIQSESANAVSQSPQPKSSQNNKSPAPNTLLPAPTIDHDKFHMHNFQRITKSPPQSRFTAAHTREFANSASLQLSPTSKRVVSDGETSPSKRRRAPDGKSIGILPSPTAHLQLLSLDEKERLTQVGASRQRERQKRDLQTSPRRRHARMNMAAVSLSDANQTPDLRPPSALSTSSSPSSSSAAVSGPRHHPDDASRRSALPGAFPGMFTSSASSPTEPAKNTQRLPPRSGEKQTSINGPFSHQMQSSSHRLHHYPGAASGLHSSSGAPGAQSSRQLPVPPRHTKKPVQPVAHKGSPSVQKPAQPPSRVGDLGRPEYSRLSGPAPQIPSTVSRHGPASPSQQPIPSSASSRQLRVASMPRSSTTHSIPRSATHRSFSSTIVPSRPSSSTDMPGSAGSGFPDNLPSYARPTQAALRRSQSIQPHRSVSKSDLHDHLRRG